MTFELFGFQAEDVEKLKGKRSRLVGNDPGTGKTYEAIAMDLANRAGDGHPSVIIPEGQVLKTLVICPKSVISVWDEHCTELTDENVFVYDDNGRQPKKAREAFLKEVLNPKYDGYFIVHWEGIRNMPELQKILFFNIIADECHRAKNEKAQQTRALKKLRTVYKTAMSGTPADNKPQDLWSILNWLWPRYYTAKWAFMKTYLIHKHEEDPTGETNGYTKFVDLNPDTIPQLRKEMAPWYTRRRKEDVLPDLPDKYNSRIWVDLTPLQRKAYDSMRKIMTVWLEDHREEYESGDPLVAQAAVSQLVRLQQFAAGYMEPRIDPETGQQAFKWKWPKGTSKEHKLKYKDDPEAGEAVKVMLWDMTDPSSKLDTLLDLIEDRDGQPIVVFSQFKAAIALLEKRLIKHGISYGLLTGDVSQVDRARGVRDFQDGKLQVFAGTIAAGGVGITLTRASTVAFIDRSWSPAINLQAEDRLHRIGQKEAVEVIDLMARNTVDLGKHQQLAKKWRTLQMLLGDVVQPELIIEELEQQGPLSLPATLLNEDPLD